MFIIIFLSLCAQFGYSLYNSDVEHQEYNIAIIIILYQLTSQTYEELVIILCKRMNYVTD